ncbi:D-alanyl-D-alanine carboxypeptidase family protein [uncultured Cohaesibacter sp.]|uniref:D-alanyl-D-alanine carboxypeptidase family protein n=1 Tax=uncultured Cohaesibacter sp. TaxID=1002546 RepID=UPI0029C87E3B|nr:D-alanyl-D-alanine carboxypeptidase family protein [uncultured Cohaesibacter sp.]
MIDLSVIRSLRLPSFQARLRPFFLACFCLMLSLSLGLIASLQFVRASAATESQKVLPELKISPNPILLLDVESGNVLYQRDANRKWYPASLTKLMTAYVIFKAIETGEISEDSVLTVSKHALSYPPAKMGFPVGTQLTVGNAIRMMIVKSANDIAAALAERVGGSEAGFAARMNAEAQRLGMHASHFVNANGLYASGHVSSARDMALIARQLLVEYPQYSYLFQIPAIRHGKTVLRSYNTLLERFRGANGMKTGFVCASGYNIVATARRNGRQLLAVVMGAPNSQIRAETAAFLLTEGFQRQDMSAGAGVSIAQEAAFGPISAVADMSPVVCPNGQVKWSPQVKYSSSYLTPRIKLMEPVRVYAGVRSAEQPVILPRSLEQLPLYAPRQKAGIPVKQQKGSNVRLAELPRAKP